MELKVIRHISSGSIGSVDLCQRPEDNVLVARKTFAPRAGSVNGEKLLLARFKQEVRFQGALQHENVMPILDSSGLHSTPPWFTMPYAEKTLRDKINEDLAAKAPFDPEPWRQILNGLGFIHRLAVHRDLKPENVLCVNDVWTIADFGLALARNEEGAEKLTETGVAGGTRFYVAPEQLDDLHSAAAQADIYSVGCMLHDAIDPMPSRRHGGQIKTVGPYAALLAKCTAERPSARYQTAAELLADLEKIWGNPKPPVTEQSLLDAVGADPSQLQPWLELIHYVERNPPALFLLRELAGSWFVTLSVSQPQQFRKIIKIICNAILADHITKRHDLVLVGERLATLLPHSNIDIQFEIVRAILFAAQMGHSSQLAILATKIMGPAASPELVERFRLEMGSPENLDKGLRRLFKYVEIQLRFPRSGWHEGITSRLLEHVGSWSEGAMLRAEREANPNFPKPPPQS